MGRAQCGHRLGELQQFGVGSGPVHPGDLVVLAVAVVVAALGPSQFVAVGDHRNTLGQQQGGDEVSLLAAAQSVDLGVVGRPLDAAVPRPVVALAVVVVLAVGQVVLVVVGHQITQGEAVVGGHEIDRRDGSPGGGLIEVGGPGDPVGELAQGGVLAAPEVSDGVAELAVPLRPLRREVADLIAPGADVPRLGDELDLADGRILLHQFEEGAEPVDVVELPGQSRGEVEAETVDVHLADPVAQRVHDQLQRMRVADVEAVSGPGVVGVVALVLVDEAVVGRVVDPPERQRGAEVVAFGGVVVDHVEDHLDTCFVQRPDHRLELLDLPAGGGARRVLAVRGEEPDGVVTPVVRQPAFDQQRVVGEMVHRHQFDRGGAQRRQVVDDHRVRDRRVGAADGVGDVGMGLGQPFDVGLVDDGIGVLAVRRSVHAPVEIRVDDDRLRHRMRRIVVIAAVRVPEGVAEKRLLPIEMAVDGLGVRVEQQFGGVAAQTQAGVVGAVHPVSVALARFGCGQVAVPDEPVDLGKRHPGLGALGVEQTQLDLLSHLGEHREVGAEPVVAGAQRIGLARPDLLFRVVHRAARRGLR